MKKTKKIIILMTIMIIIISTLAVNAESKETKNNVETKLNKKIIYTENKQVYETEKGTHTIYWAQGITPPKMTNDSNLLGKKGYFTLEKKDDFETYSAEFEPGKGYFDYNKNLDDRGYEHPLCYLGAASNLISWWLEQNKTYVEEYVNRLKTTNIYGQYEGLYKILPFEQTMWDEMRLPPAIEIQQKYKAQKLGKSPLVTKYLKPYYYKKNVGYFADMVIDFFFNGYEAIPDLEYTSPNTEENFKKDPRGGFFFPLLGKKQISQRLTGGKYNTYNYMSENLRKMFSEGKGVSLGYEVNAIKAHAITVWGAEYDENNKLCRIFITDSDDYQPSKPGDEYWRGMVGFNTIADKNGKLCLTNNTNPNPNKPGNYVNDIITIDLAKDFLEERLNDTKPPKKPEIIEEPHDLILAKGAKREVEVKAKNLDTGFLEYEWYVSNDKNSIGTKIPNENKPKITITADELGEKYYYCKVKNVKNGKTEIIETTHFKLEVQDVKIVNAETPKVDFNYQTVSYNQYDAPIFPKIIVNASVQDGGTLTYQWYQANDNSAENGRKLEGETKNIIYPPTNIPSNGLYYYCEITNTNKNVTGNSKVTVKTPYSKKVIINEAELLEAKIPTIISQPQNITVNQYDEINPIKIEAKIFDGGKLSYQWYEVDELYNAIPLENEKGESFKPDTKIVGTKMYKCEIKNTNNLAKNKKETSTFTNIFTVEVKGDKIESNNNNIEKLTLLNATLTPKFDKNITSYQAILAHKDSKLDLEVIVDPKAKVTINNQICEIGETKDVKIIVEAEDKTTKTYIIKVTRDDTHNFNNWEILENPTCIKEGKEKRICNECGYEETRQIQTIDHNWNIDWTIDENSTCKKEGTKSHHCKICGTKKDITKIAKKSHEFGTWKVLKEATTTEKGKEGRFCKNCGITEFREIPIKEEINKPENQPNNEKPNNEKPNNNKPANKPNNNKPIKQEQNKKEDIEINEEKHKKPEKQEEKQEEAIIEKTETEYLPKAGNKTNKKVIISVAVLTLTGILGIGIYINKKR